MRSICGINGLIQPQAEDVCVWASRTSNNTLILLPCSDSKGVRRGHRLERDIKSQGISDLRGFLFLAHLSTVCPLPCGGSGVHGSHQSGAVRLESRNGLVRVHASTLPVV